MLNKQASAGSIYSSPAMDWAQRFFYGSNDGYFYARYPCGSLVSKMFTGAPITTSPALSYGKVYFTSKKGLYTYDPVQKKLIFSSNIGAPIISSPVIGYDGTIYYGSMNGKVYAYDPIQKKMLLSASTGGAIQTSPAIGADGRLYVGNDAGYFRMFIP